MDKLNRGGFAEKVNINKKGGLRGFLKIIVEEFGVKRVHYDNKNLIVDGARKAMSHLVAEADNDYKIVDISIGTQGHDLGPPEDILTPVAPTVTDTSLIDPAPYTKAIDVFEYLPVGTETTVKFTTVYEKAEANGSGSVAYTEAGMLTVNGTLFCRQTFPALVKTNTRKIVIEWTIIF